MLLTHGLNQKQEVNSMALTFDTISGQPNASGIQDFSLPSLQQPQAPVPAQAPIVAQGQQTLDLKGELATIRAMKQGSSSGLGQTIGGTAGTAAGAVVGGPTGAAVGGTAGSTIGTIVDYMINMDASKKAEQIRLDALMKEKNNMQKKEASQMWLQRLADAQNESVANFNKRATKSSVAKQMQNQLMLNMMSKLGAAKARKQGNKQSFLEGRTV
jgi:outer membrane lipoprotein SlyB